jgi:hypothetical protein
VTNLEESLCDYYATKADQLELPDRVFDTSIEFDATVSYISMGPEPRRRAPMLLAAAASIALLAGAAVVVSRSGQTTSNPLAVDTATTATVVPTVSPDEIQILAPTWLPDGYVLKVAEDNGGSSHRPRTIVYRNPSLPLGSPVLIVHISNFQPQNAGTAITLQGRPALLNTSHDLTVISLTDPKGLEITVISRSIGIDELTAVAETITARTDNAADGFDISSLPVGFEVVLDQPALSHSYRHISLEYGKTGSKTESLLIGISNEPLPADEMLAASMATPDELGVRGHKAWDTSPTMEPGTSGITWTESPSLGIFLKSKSIDAATVKRIAESLQPITPSEFAKMQADLPPQIDSSAFGGPTAPEGTSNQANGTAPANGTVVTTCESQAVATCGPGDCRNFGVTGSGSVICCWGKFGLRT